MILLVFFLICIRVYISYKRGDKSDAIVFGIMGGVLVALFLLLSTL